MLKIQNITKKFGGVTALDNCSFTIASQKTTALVGPNGAGKTTLFDVISGLLRVDSGSIMFDSREILSLRSDEITRFGITRTWQQVRLFKYLSIQDHLQLAADQEDTKLFRNFVLGSQHASAQSSNASRLKLDPGNLSAFAKHFGIEKPIETLVSDLSYGQRKLLQLAVAVLQPHKILLLDEPVAGVNKVIQQKIEHMLLHLKAMGETIVVIEHDMEFVKKLADTVVVLDAGAVLTEGRPDVVLKDKRVVEAYLGG